MRVIAHVGVFANIGVVAQRCVRKASAKLFDSISAQVSDLSHRGAIRAGNTQFGREVACYREWLRDTYGAATICRRDFTSRFGGAHAEMRKLFSLNRNTVSTQSSTERAHVPQPTAYRYTRSTEYLHGNARNLPKYRIPLPTVYGTTRNLLIHRSAARYGRYRQKRSGKT